MGDTSYYFNQLVAFLAAIWSMWEVRFMLAHIALNFVAALAATIRSGEFVLARSAEVLYRKVLPYVLLWAGFTALGEAANFPGASIVVFGIIEASLTGDLLDNLSKLGVNLPEWTTKSRMA